MKTVVTNSERTKYSEVLWLMVAISVPTIFSAIFAFKFAPLTEGWWHVYAKWIQNGRVPYSDFELLVPPLYPNLITFLDSIGFGQFYTLRAIGLLLVGMTSFVIFQIIRAFARAKISALVTAGAMVYLQTGTAYINYDYIFVAMLFQALAFLPFSLFLTSSYRKQLKSFLITSSISGLFAGLTLLTKQSNGVSAIIATLLLVIFLSRGVESKKSFFFGVSQATVFGLASFISGILISLIYPILSMIAQGSFGDFLEDVGPQALSTKGGVFTSQTAWITGLITTSGLTMSVTALIPLIVGFVLVNGFAKNMPANSQNILQGNSRIHEMTLGLFLGAGALIFGILYNGSFIEYFQGLKYLPTIILLVLISFQLNRETGAVSALPAVFCSFSLIWSSGMSAGLAETAMFLGVATVIAYFASKLKIRAIATFVLIFFVSATVANAFVAKSQTPFNWWSFSTPALDMASSKISSGYQAGLATDSKTKQILDFTSQNLGQLETCSGEIVQFPHAPLFQLDQGNLPLGRVATTWFDFSSQAEIAKEIQRLKTSKVKAIILLLPPWNVWKSHEELFLAGGLSGQRELLRYLQRIALEFPVSYKWNLEGGYVLHLSMAKCSSNGF